MSQRRGVCGLVLSLLVLAGTLGCAANDDGAKAGPSLTATPDIKPVPFDVKCAGVSFTLYGVPGESSSSPSFLSETSRVVTPLSFHITAKVFDTDGKVVLDRIDDGPDTAVDPSAQKCSFDVYTEDEAGNTYTARGTASALFTT